MKILILGGNRFVGRALAKRIIRVYKKCHVDVFNRSGTGPKTANVIRGNRNSLWDLKRVDFDKYDCIVDMCLFNITQFLMLDGFIPSDTNYIFISSGAADKRYVSVFDEYGSDKRMIEKCLSRTDMNYKIVRPSYIIGKGDHRSRLDYFISRLKNKETIEISGSGNHLINFVFIQDAVNCLLKLVEDNDRTYKTYNICGDKSITINGLIELLKIELNIADHKTKDAKDTLFPNNAFEFDNSDIKNDYGIIFTDLKSGIKEYIQKNK